MYRRVAQHVFKYNRNFSSSSAFPSPIQNPPLPNTGIFINNEYQKARSGEVFETINPATEQVITQVQRARKEDVDLAVEAAANAFKLGSPWRTMDASERGRLLYKLAALMERDTALLASLESIDGGSPFTLTTYFTQYAMSCLRYYAGYADKHHGKTIPMDGNFFAYTRPEPVGVCGQIIPWNGPLLMFCVKIAPALAMGNTVVIKPAELTPLTALHMGKLIVEAGIPPGVVNIIPGYGDAGEAICKNTNVAKIAFTGSTRVGMKIQEASGVGNLKRTTLELGGKSPNIILDDVDLPTAVEWAHQAVFMNQGQACIAGSRTFVQASIYDDFVQKSAERAKHRIVGDPFDPKTEQGPQISEAQAEKIQSLVKCGVKEGAALVTGGSRFGDKGFFFQPTVFAEVQDHHTIAKEEIFGPVQQLIRFNTLEELIDRANDTSYGLGAGIFTKDVDKINYLSAGIKSGMVWVNCYGAAGPQTPFGGFKNSGLGREMGEDGLNQYTEIKTVVTAIPQKNS